MTQPLAPPRDEVRMKNAIKYGRSVDRVFVRMCRELGVNAEAAYCAPSLVIADANSGDAKQ